MALSTPAKFVPRRLQDSGPTAIPLFIRCNKKYESSTNQLIETEGDANKFSLVPEAADLFRSIDKPVAVVTICGSYRTGKSFFLSRLLGDSKAFKVGSLTSACTQGIWMATTVLECDDYVIVLLDTEGINSVEVSSAGDSPILVLSILLSSYLIYNSMRVPTREDLKQMSYFTQLSKSIVIRAGEDPADMVKFRSYFPHFLWLLRDASLSLPTDESGKQLTALEYLETKVLCQQRRFSLDFPPEDRVANAIQSYFRSVDCIMLPAPSADAAVLQNMTDPENEAKLSVTFREQIEITCQHVLQKAPPKTAYNPGAHLTGPTLIELANQYLAQLNSPQSIVQLCESWENAVDARLKKESVRLLVEYEKRMNEELHNRYPLDEKPNSHHPSNAETLLDIHFRVYSELYKELEREVNCLLCPHLTDEGHKKRDEILKHFETKTAVFENVDVKAVHRVKVVDGVLCQFIAENEQKSVAHCDAVFEEVYLPVQQMIEAAAASPETDYNYSHVMSDMNEVEERYYHKAIGPAKEEVFRQRKEKALKYFDNIFKVREKLMESLLERVQILMRDKEEYNQRIVALSEDMELLKRQLREKEEQRILLEQEHKEHIKRLVEQKDRDLALERERQETFTATKMEEAKQMSEMRCKEIEEQFQERIDVITKDQHQEKERHDCEMGQQRRQIQEMEVELGNTKKEAKKTNDELDNQLKVVKELVNRNDVLEQEISKLQQEKNELDRTVQELNNRTDHEAHSIGAIFTSFKRWLFGRRR